MNAGHLHVEVTADTLESAVEKALDRLNCTRAEADIEIVQTHSSGLLGLFGKRPARVSVKLRDRGAIARQFCQKLVALSGFDADIELISASSQILLNVNTQDVSRLIGRHGQTLDALQSLVETMTDRQTTDRTPILIDVDGYRQRRQAFLLRLARRMSSRVSKSGKPFTSPPLNLHERRILYDIFKQDPALVATSKPHDGDRKVIVLRQGG